jgi:hypothetical protein
MNQGVKTPEQANAEAPWKLKHAMHTGLSRLITQQNKMFRPEAAGKSPKTIIFKRFNLKTGKFL